MIFLWDVENYLLASRELKAKVHDNGNIGPDLVGSRNDLDAIDLIRQVRHEHMEPHVWLHNAAAHLAGQSARRVIQHWNDSHFWKWNDVGDHWAYNILEFARSRVVGYPYNFDPRLLLSPRFRPSNIFGNTP